jgi:hypothetical protein
MRNEIGNRGFHPRAYLPYVGAKLKRKTMLVSIHRAAQKKVSWSDMYDRVTDYEAYFKPYFYVYPGPNDNPGMGLEGVRRFKGSWCEQLAGSQTLAIWRGLMQDLAEAEAKLAKVAAKLTRMEQAHDHRRNAND